MRDFFPTISSRKDQAEYLEALGNYPLVVNMGNPNLYTLHTSGCWRVTSLTGVKTKWHAKKLCSSEAA